MWEKIPAQEVEMQETQEVAPGAPSAGSPPVPMAPSRLGTASFIISMSAILFFFLLIFGAGAYAAMSPEEDLPLVAFVVVGLLAILGLLACLVGFGLGIAGLFQRDRRKLFSVLGLVFNGLVLLGFAALQVVGSMIPED